MKFFDEQGKKTIYGHFECVPPKRDIWSIFFMDDFADGFRCLKHSLMYIQATHRGVANIHQNGIERGDCIYELAEIRE